MLFNGERAAKPGPRVACWVTGGRDLAPRPTMFMRKESYKQGDHQGPEGRPPPRPLQMDRARGCRAASDDGPTC